MLQRPSNAPSSKQGTTEDSSTNNLKITKKKEEGKRSKSIKKQAEMNGDCSLPPLDKKLIKTKKSRKYSIQSIPIQEETKISKTIKQCMTDPENSEKNNKPEIILKDQCNKSSSITTLEKNIGEFDDK